MYKVAEVLKSSGSVCAPDVYSFGHQAQLLILYLGFGVPYFNTFFLKEPL